jgi:hypothetical protein
VRSDSIDKQAWCLAEFERSEEFCSSGHPPKVSQLFAETALALAVPLLFALLASLWLGAS